MNQFTYHSPDNSTGETKAALEEMRKVYGFIPNLFAYMAEAPVTIEAYANLNGLLNKTAFSPAQQQVVLLAASVENECDFCTTAHRATGKMSQARQQTLDALHSGAEIEEASDRALVALTRQVVKRRGHLRQEEIDDFLQAGFNRRQLLEVVFMVAIKTLTNYINHLTGPEPNPELVAML